MKSIVLVTLTISLCAPAADRKLPLPFHSRSVNNRPRIIPRPDGAQLRVPAGFEVEVFAEGFELARYMALGPKKEILLSYSRAGIVYVLQPERKKLIEKLDRPYGLAFWKDYLYVAETTSVKRYKYDAKTLTAGPGEEIVNMKDFGRGHWTRHIIFDRAGKKLYLAVGSASNVDAGEPAMRAAIHRFNPDGSGHEPIASGTRNPTAIRFYPGTDQLWAAVQERDLLGDDLVPDYFTAIRTGGFYGWPYAYVGPNEDPRRKGERPDLVTKTIVPDVLLGSHVAVIDAIFYTGHQFPKSYHGGAFLAYHGSWNRSERVGQSVAFLPFKNGKPTGEPEEFLTGWMLGPDRQEVWGRPVGLLELPDGSLLVSEDAGNKVWRVSYRGQ